MDIVDSLKSVEAKYKNKPTPTGETVISDMAFDCRKEIEMLREHKAKLICCGNCKHWKYRHQKCGNESRKSRELEEVIFKSSIDKCDSWEFNTDIE